MRPRTCPRETYEGNGGYPEIIAAELAQRARAALTRADPAARQRRAGGRPPREDAYILRGIAHCVCGEPLYACRKYLGGARAYVCRDKVHCTGTCSRPPIPAEWAEAHVMRHLDVFGLSVKEWIAECLKEHSAEQIAGQSDLDAQVAQLADLDAQRDARMAELADIGITELGLEVVARIDHEREAVDRKVEEARAALSEWTVPPDVDAALDFYNGLVALIQGRVAEAKGALELNTALHEMLAGIWMALDDGQLRADFALQRPAHPEGDFLSYAFPAGRRVAFDDPLPSGYLPPKPTESPTSTR